MKNYTACFLSVFLIFSIISISKAQPFHDNKIIAHRGAWKNTGAPQNSIAALKAAIQLGCVGSEFDVRMTKDEVLVVCHDPHHEGLDIEKSTYTDLLTKPLKNGEPIPTLEQYFKAGKKQKKTILVTEIKPSPAGKERSLLLAEKVVALVRKMNVQNKVVYISFDYDILKKVHQLDKTAKTQYLNGNIPAPQIQKDGITGVDYHFSIFQNDESWLGTAQKLGIMTNAWTVNDTAVMDYLFLKNIDFLTTDEPEIALKRATRLSKNITSTTPIAYWLTHADQSVLLQKQSFSPIFNSPKNNLPTIDINPAETFQVIDGFGFTLTGASAYLINRLKPHDKQQLLEELFTNKGINISYLRLSIGASDLHQTAFTYNDLPEGETDLELKRFSLDPDRQEVLPLLKEIVRLNPKMKFLATPWSPPVWMKDTNSFVGGSLQPRYYDVYAQYFVKYVQHMKTEGIDIQAITPQNEPLHPGNNPSLLMTAEQQKEFIKNHLATAFKKANIKTKIIIYDHNCDKPEYPLSILDDPAVKPLVWGSAFHLYSGDISALSKVHEAHPDKHLYFTEQYTASDGNFGGDLHWHFKNVLIGSIRHWSKTVFEWNLANDPAFKLHTEGGCTTCKGALTIGENVHRNVSYYIIAHASKFIPSGSVRIASNHIDNVTNVAFKTPTGNIILIVQNEQDKDISFNTRIQNKWATVTIPAKGVATLVVL